MHPICHCTLTGSAGTRPLPPASAAMEAAPYPAVGPPRLPSPPGDRLRPFCLHTVT